MEKVVTIGKIYHQSTTLIASFEFYIKKKWFDNFDITFYYFYSKHVKNKQLNTLKTIYSLITNPKLACSST